MKKSRAATRTIKILELIASEANGLSLSEIAAHLDIPITSVNDIVKALLDEEMIDIIDERSKLYGIGVKAFFIGNSFIANTSLIDKSKDIIADLGASSNKTVFLGKELDGKITYIYKYEPKDTLVTTCAIGSRTSIHCTSLGKCMLAYHPEMLERLRHEKFVKKTPFTITDFETLKEDVLKVKELGYALDDREQNDHLLCIGAPIFDSNGVVIASVSVSGLYRGDEDIPAEGLAVKVAADTISRKLGYKG